MKLSTAMHLSTVFNLFLTGWILFASNPNDSIYGQAVFAGILCTTLCAVMGTLAETKGH